MQLDPVLAEDTLAWFRKARTDLRSAEADLAADPPILEDVVFHCQQAAEKAMKGFLTWHQHPFGKTHDLRELGRVCGTIDETLTTVLEKAYPLTWYAWKYRYPGAPEQPSLDEALGALSVAREVVEACLSRVPREAKP